jgi:hypothetical protein
VEVGELEEAGTNVEADLATKILMNQSQRFGRSNTYILQKLAQHCRHGMLHRSKPIVRTETEIHANYNCQRITRIEIRHRQSRKYKGHLGTRYRGERKIDFDTREGIICQHSEDG